MKIFNILGKFKNDTSGAVTTDWVMLVAAIVGISITAGVAMRPALEETSTDIKFSIMEATDFIGAKTNDHSF